MEPPTLRPASLGLRFGLEIAALAGLFAGAWAAGDGQARGPRTATAVAAVLAAALPWSLFNVPGDPSRSGRAPIPVDGRLRLGLEFAVFAAGALGWWFAGRSAVAALLAGLVLLHASTEPARLRWVARYRTGR